MGKLPYRGNEKYRRTWEGFVPPLLGITFRIGMREKGGTQGFVPPLSLRPPKRKKCYELCEI